MTLIKCFTASHIDNIAACLRLQPEKMILVGNDDHMEQAAERYRAFLRQRKLSTSVSVFHVGSNKNFSALCAALRTLAGREHDPVIDLTGGDETVILAIGAMVESLEPRARQQIRVEEYDRKTGYVLDCLQGKRFLPKHPVNINVEELISLHGGTLHPDAYQPPLDFTVDNLAQVWKQVAKNPTQWNQSIKLLGRFESQYKGESKSHIQLELAKCNIPDLDLLLPELRKFLKKLQRCGILTDRSSDTELNYTYKSPMMRCCTQKAGNVLELKTLLEARAMTEKGVPFFHDARMSVSIDWDGEILNKHGVAETRNEIDVVLMHGITPLFISCKNGGIKDEELYKLHTVTRCFGGPYAGKMLVATDLDLKNDNANSSFSTRAWDMDILLVKEGANLTSEQWQMYFKSALL